MKFQLSLITVALAAVIAGCHSNNKTDSTTNQPKTASRVLLISVDGMHQQDLDLCVKNNTCPNIAALSQSGVTYTDAHTPGLSDSFPGLAALVTGGSPKSAGLFYDVSYDRTLYAPKDTNCTGPQGWNVVFDETVGKDAMNGGDLVNLNGGGGFNPQAIPNTKINGVCTPVYPHNYIKTNTIFEVVKQNVPNAVTAFADKHAWGYDWLNGPSGNGVTDLARTEINSIDPATKTDYTDIYTHTEKFDDYHVQAIINQIDGKDSTGATAQTVPTLFGTNFQTLSVAQKQLNSTGGGYVDAKFTPNTSVAAAIAYVDSSIGKMVAELKAKGLYNTTAIVITAKHGQSPSDHSTLVKNGDTLTNLLQVNNFLPSDGNWGQNNTASGNLNDGTGLVGTGMVQTDDVGLIWLKDNSAANVQAAVNMLKQNLGCTATTTSTSGTVTNGGICADKTGYILSSVDGSINKFGDPAQGRTPDIIVQPNYGVIYTSSKKKDAEHGGNAPDDSHVALLVSLAGIQAQTNTTTVGTTQVAPTILKYLSLDPSLLNSVKAEETQVLPGLF